MPGSAKECSGAPENAQERRRVPGIAGKCQGVPGNVESPLKKASREQARWEERRRVPGSSVRE